MYVEQNPMIHEGLYDSGVLCFLTMERGFSLPLQFRRMGVCVNRGRTRSIFGQSAKSKITSCFDVS